MARRALLVGIDKYRDPNIGDLHGAVHDATMMRDVITTHEDGSRNYDCRLYTSPGQWPVTRGTLRSLLRELFHEAESVLFFFAGHGTPTDVGGVLVTEDAENDDFGIPMSELLVMANRSRAREVFLILDCCFSGSLGNPAILQGDVEDRALLREGVTILAASRPTETSAEVGGKGLFTALVLHALYGGAADILGNVTSASIYAHVEQSLGSWDQRPLFKTHASKLSPIRRCHPQIPIDVLRLLPTIFPDPMKNLPLTPSYEPTEEPRDAAKEQTFEHLKKFRDSGLLRTVSGEDLYYAAMRSGEVRLTGLGRFYWRLMKEGRL